MQDGGDGKDAVGVFGRIHEIPSFKRHNRGALVNFLKGSLIVIRLGAESELSDLVPFLILPMGGSWECMSSWGSGRVQDAISQRGFLCTPSG